MLDDFGVGGRSADNELFPDPVRFPNGIKALADYAHAKGFTKKSVVGMPVIHIKPSCTVYQPLNNCITLVDFLWNSGLWYEDHQNRYHIYIITR
jgi:hypothetical protein